MKNILSVFVSLVLISGSCWGQVMFQKLINVHYQCTANDLEQTSDGGYIITGYAADTTAGYNHIYLVKTNAYGDIEWTKTYTGLFYQTWSNSVIQTSDGGYIIAGEGFRAGLVNADILIIKTNATGDTIWTRSYGGPVVESAYSIRQTFDGGYIILGETDSFSAAYDFYLVKISAAGDLTWTRTYGGVGYETGYSVRQTADSGYILCGNTSSFGVGIYDIYLVKTDVNGDTLWSKTYGSINADYPYSLDLTSDGGYIIAGNYFVSGANYSTSFLLKTDAHGTMIWKKAYGVDKTNGFGSSDAYDAHQTSDGGYVFAGNTLNSTDSLTCVYLVKTNSVGDTLWTRAYYDRKGVNANSVRQTLDGYIIAGISYTNPMSFIYLIKTDSIGNTGCNQKVTYTIDTAWDILVGSPSTIVGTGGDEGPIPIIIGSKGIDSTICVSVGINELSQNNSFLISPNPVTTQLTIRTSLKDEYVTVSIMNVLGQEVFQSSIFNLQSSIDVSKLSSGIYFLQLKGESGSVVRKFVKE